jgi:hypothetical protein
MLIAGRSLSRNPIVGQGLRLPPAVRIAFDSRSIAIAWLAMEFTSVVIAMRVTRIAKVLEEIERRDN